jgi:hypothetical protein
MQATWIVTITRLDGKQRPLHEEWQHVQPNHGDVFTGTADGEKLEVRIAHVGKFTPPKVQTDFLGTWEVTAFEIAG